MRTKALLKYHFSTLKLSILIFSLFYILGSGAASIIMANTNNVVMGSSAVIDGQMRTFSTSIVAFSVYMIIASLICAQQDTRFLITRSVARKEIFLLNVLSLAPIALIMSIVQQLMIHIDSLIRWIATSQWRGTEVDLQIFQAPDMKNPVVFLAVSFSIMFLVGSASYLFGSLIAKWRLQTAAVSIVLPVVGIALLSVSNHWMKLIDAFTFMFTDENSGLRIVLKCVTLALVLLLAAFPVVRRITAAKQ